jgi:S-methylmethionine-dependent homocysteine/selenocysteine methylase
VKNLPQLNSELFLTDGGIETQMIFEKGIDLPYFAAYLLLLEEKGLKALKEYLDGFLQAASKAEVGLILETPTWRASADWGEKLGHDALELARINREAVHLLREQAESREQLKAPVVVSGCMGPRGDGYQAHILMTRQQAQEYHQRQVDALVEGGADQVSAMTMTYTEEAIGFCLAARKARVPLVLSFTVETDGLLPGGESLGSALQKVDEASQGYPAYYMVNCAHPTHMECALSQSGPWLERLGGIKPNASSKSHEELNNCKEIDHGDPEDLARRCVELRRRLPRLNVFGGCCGTHLKHFESMASALAN